MARHPLTNALVGGVLAGQLLAGCGGGAPAPLADTEGEQLPAGDGTFTRRTYERSFVFATLEGDSLFVVPWLLETVETPDSVEREATGWLARGGVWEEFYTVRWGSSSTRAPSRVLPYGSVSFVVGEGDAIDGIIFDEGPRSLELVLGDVSAAWTGPRGEAIEILEGAAYLSDQRVDGMVLDMARASGEGVPPVGDWAFLLSGDSARFVFAAEREHGGDTEPIYRGWGDLDESVIQWAEIHMDWQQTQAFPPARRDVPVAWRLWSSDGLTEGELEAVSAEIRPGPGPGPLLPVRALFEVVGRLSTVEGNFEVHGLLVHERR